MGTGTLFAILKKKLRLLDFWLNSEVSKLSDLSNMAGMCQANIIKLLLEEVNSNIKK